MLKYAAAILLMFMASSAQAQVYRWVDENGAVNYGSKPPAGGDSTELQLPTEPTGAGTPAPATTIDRDRLLKSYEHDRLARQRAIEQKREQQRQREQLCKALEARWRLYTSAGRLYEVADDGSLRFLSASEKDAELARLRKGLEENCDGLPETDSHSERR